MGNGDWGLGIGDWAQSPIPNPQSPIPNPQSPFVIIFYNNNIILNKIYIINKYTFEKKNNIKSMLILLILN